MEMCLNKPLESTVHEQRKKIPTGIFFFFFQSYFPVEVFTNQLFSLLFSVLSSASVSPSSASILELPSPSARASRHWQRGTDLISVPAGTLVDHVGGGNHVGVTLVAYKNAHALFGKEYHG